MKKYKWSVEKIILIFNENEARVAASEHCRKHGMSDATFHNWRKKYCGMSLSNPRREKDLESENARVKRFVVYKELEIDALKDVLLR